jgi:hypothetical protein
MRSFHFVLGSVLCFSNQPAPTDLPGDPASASEQMNTASRRAKASEREHVTREGRAKSVPSAEREAL